MLLLFLLLEECEVLRSPPGGREARKKQAIHLTSVLRAPLQEELGLELMS